MDITSLRIGTTLHLGTYEIRRVLGRGGFGITYLAWDNSLDKEVAIKEFFPQTLCGREETTNHITLGTQSNEQLLDELKRKFIKEAKNIARLQHPNIISIYTSFEENNTAYYVMDYIRGESLGEMVKRGGALPQREATDYIRQIGSALAYLHANHMTHLDVKPANIMVRSSDNCPILIDFGLSKNYDQAGMQTTTRGPMGISPGFSPIEQYALSGVKEFSPKSDLYSLAATYYYLLTGIVPPEAMANDTESMTFPAGISPAIKNAILKAMSYHASRRHESVNEFLKHIEGKHPGGKVAGGNSHVDSTEKTQVLTGTQVIDTPYEPKMPTGGNQRNKVMMYGAIGIIAVLVVVVILLLVGGKEDKKTDIYDSAVVAAIDSTNSTTDTEEATASTETPLETSPFGPFASRQEVMDFVKNHFAMSQGTNIWTGDLAETIVTDFGTPMSFTKSQYVKQARDYAISQNLISGQHDFDWNKLVVTPLPDGGAQIKFEHNYEMTCLRNGMDYVREFRCKSEIRVNSNKKVNYVKDKSTKLNEWYN